MTKKVRSMTNRPARRLFSVVCSLREQKSSRGAKGLLLGSLVLVALGPAAAIPAENAFLPDPAWEAPTPAGVFAQLEDYLQSAEIAPDRQALVRDAWRSGGESADGDLLDRLANSFGKSDEQVAELVAFCSRPRTRGPLPEFAWLANSETPRLVRHNMRLYLARWLVQQGYFDEALSWTEGLATDDVVAPDALLFYRAIAHHRLVQPNEADAALGQLLQREEGLPTRYQKLAGLMRQDLAGLEDESLDHIARRMEDIRRRLALGRSGERVQGVENGVIESLDKLIKKLEDQMQQSQCAGAAGGQPSGTPMQDSRIAELKAPGKVEPRDVGRGDGWGNLPDKDREKALQEIGREFPSHYREVIEEYFRRLAAEEPANNP
jgi:hypothetical protein